MIETSVAIITSLEEDVIRVEYKPDAFVDVKEFMENLEAYKKILKSKKAAYFLTVANPGSSSSLEVRNMFSSPERSAFKLGEAFVISTLAQRILANFVTRVRPPAHPLRFFTSENEARKWLMKLREKHKKENAKR